LLLLYRLSYNTVPSNLAITLHSFMQISKLRKYRTMGI
jgi:hypothetical protein